MSILSRWGFTRREKSAICILAAALLIGSVISVYRQQILSKELDELSAGDSSAISRLGEFARGLTATSPDSTGDIISVPEKNIDFPIDINIANLEELQVLPGIGPVLSARIIAYRTQHGAFISIDSLVKVPGIGKQRIEKIKDKITVTQPRTED